MTAWETATHAQLVARVRDLEGRLCAPGHFQCPSCHLHLSKTNDDPCTCETCGTPMWKVTWKVLYRTEQEARRRLVKEKMERERLS